MSKTSKILPIAIISVLLCASAASAAAPFQLAMPRVQAPRDPDVEGVRLVLLYGENVRVTGLDLGLAALSEAKVQSGLTLNLGVSIVHGTSSGAPIALVNVHRGHDRGVNFAFVNAVETAKTGANVGFVNITSRASAVDIGGLNVSEESSTQIGMLNVTREIRGLQIGLLNFAGNGFLPVFPLFNYPKR